MLRPLRILSVTPCYPPQVGGGEKYAHRTNSGLVERGAFVHVVTESLTSARTQSLDGVEVSYLQAKRFLRFPWFSLRRVFRAVREHGTDAVLVYGPSPYDPVVAIICRLLRRPYVQVYHADFNQDRLATRIVTWLHNAVALRLSDTIVCTNARMVNTLKTRGYADRVVRITPGVDEKYFASSPDDRSNTQDILFVGALDDAHEYKRLDLLLAAVQRLHSEDSSWRLRVVGDGGRRTAFMRLAQSIGVAGSVNFVGAVDDEELVRCYQTSGVFVLPSPTAREGFGLVCLEAMATGLPVVCSVNAGAASIVAAAPACALWDGRRVSDLTRAIKLAGAATLADRDRLRTYALQFSWSAMTGQLMQVLQNLDFGHERRDNR